MPIDGKVGENDEVIAEGVFLIDPEWGIAGLASYIYEYHTDPSHGWLRVSYLELVRLGIEDKISDCSYMRGTFAYLEEDCDAAVFIDAMCKINEAYKVDCKHTDDDSKVRSMYPYGKRQDILDRCRNMREAAEKIIAERFASA